MFPEEHFIKRFTEKYSLKIECSPGNNKNVSQNLLYLSISYCTFIWKCDILLKDIYMKIRR